MKNQIKVLIFSLLQTVASTSICFAASAWEYLVKTYPLMGNDSAITQQMNQLGKQQWELVNCTEGDARITCVFKRPIQEQ